MIEEIKTDYCVVGGGIAGILLASKLASSGKKILILDQGPRISEEDRANLLLKSKENLNEFADYNDNVDVANITPHTSAKAEGETIKYKNDRLFGIGGTALHFGGIMMRPLIEDLSVKSLYGYGRDWPITYSEIEPWLLKAEYEIGVSGNNDNPYASFRSGPFPMPGHPFSHFDNEIFGPALKKLGIVGHSYPFAINSTPYRGRSACLACRACKFCPSGARYSPDRVHVPILEKQDNVTILENLSVRKLETDSKGNRIIAVHAKRIKDKSSVIIHAKKFILAMGGLETPRMLMLSNDNNNHQNGLGNMGGQLGRGFSEHPYYYLMYDVGQPVGNRLGYETMVTEHFRVKVDRRKQPTFIFYGAPLGDWVPDIKSTFHWVTKNDILSLEKLQKVMQQTALIGGMTEVEGKGKLELDSNSLDDFGDPVVKATMKITEWDRRGLTKLQELALKVGEAMGAKNSSKFFLDEEFWGIHPSGATAMANNPDQGVCDRNLKVFGLENLYLVSNSVFPHMGSNPATLTIAALTLRLAAHFEGKI